MRAVDSQLTAQKPVVALGPHLPSSPNLTELTQPVRAEFDLQNPVRTTFQNDSVIEHLRVRSVVCADDASVCANTLKTDPPLSMVDKVTITSHGPALPSGPKSEVQRHIRNAIYAGFKKRKVNKCAHPDKPYYAKSMCVNCYHRLGRTKMAWKCQHQNVIHYSKGLCKHCYLSAYYKERTQRKRNNTNNRSQASDSDKHSERDASSELDASSEPEITEGKNKNEVCNSEP